MSNWTHKSHSNIARVNTASHFKTDRRENSWLIAVVNLHKISNWTHKLHVTTQLHISRPIAEKIVDLLRLSICIKSQTEHTNCTWQHGFSHFRTGHWSRTDHLSETFISSIDAESSRSETSGERTRGTFHAPPTTPSEARSRMSSTSMSSVSSTKWD